MPGYLMREGTYETTCPPTYRNQLISFANSVAEESEGKGLQTLYIQFSQAPTMTVNIYGRFLHMNVPILLQRTLKVRGIT